MLSTGYNCISVDISPKRKQNTNFTTAQPLLYSLYADVTHKKIISNLK
jgi:hypothetical protein